MNVQLVTDTSYANQDGEMDVTPIVVDNTMTFDAIDGILFYGFEVIGYCLEIIMTLNPSVTLIVSLFQLLGLDEWASMNLKHSQILNDWMNWKSRSGNMEYL